MKVMEKLKLFIDAHIDDFRNGVNTEYVDKIDIGYDVNTVRKLMNKLCNVRRAEHKIPGINKRKRTRIYTLKYDYHEPKYKDVETQTWLW